MKARTIAAGLGIALAALGPVQAASAPRPQGALRPKAVGTPSPAWWVQIPYTQPGGVPWSPAAFRALAARGATGVEINLAWGAIEPRPGKFDLTLLDRYVAACAAARIQLVPIFWESVWPGNPPAWLQAGHERTSQGAPADQPPFWSRRALAAYEGYVAEVLRALAPQPGFGGAFLAYGWLDAVWGPPPGGAGIAGYAPQDVAAFRRWLQERYRTLGNLNRALGTRYRAWSDIPAFRPGQDHFALYQEFRLGSYGQVMASLLQLARRITSKPLYLYFGGGMGDAGELGNIPDTAFALARAYGATVVLDDAEVPALADLFGYLAQAYGVPLMHEWTPGPGLDRAEFAQWLSHVALQGRTGAGEDYFLVQGEGNEAPYVSATLPSYFRWRAALQSVRGSLPAYPVGVMLGYEQVTRGGALPGLPGGSALLDAWLTAAHPAVQVFSDIAVARGLVDLNRLHVLVDWNRDLSSPVLDPELRRRLAAFRRAGGEILPGPGLTTPGVAPVANPDGLYTVATVQGRTALVSRPGAGGTRPFAQYLYFSVPETVVPLWQSRVTVTLTVASKVPNALELQYDSSDPTAPVNGAYKAAGPAIAVPADGRWHTLTFHLGDAYFAGQENGGADFRVAAERPGLAVAQVVVSGQEKATYRAEESPRPPQVPSTATLSPPSDHVEVWLAEGKGWLYVVVANAGEAAYRGVLSVPAASALGATGPGKVLALPGSGAGAIAAGAFRWKVNLPLGALAVLALPVRAPTSSTRRP